MKQFSNVFLLVACAISFAQCGGNGDEQVPPPSRTEIVDAEPGSEEFDGLPEADRNLIEGQRFFRTERATPDALIDWKG